MVFQVKNKVALVTGGASGIGLGLVKELLRNGAKGVIVADINIEIGEEVIKDLSKEFDGDRVAFVLTDTSNPTSFENAFKVAIERFKNIDILINNAGICNDNTWERQIDVNLKGTAQGIILALEKYLKNHKQSEEAVIVNTASTAPIIEVPVTPLYNATKAGILAMTTSWGQTFHYERTKVRTLAICPGITDTPILKDVGLKTLIPEYTEYFKGLVDQHTPQLQSPGHVAQETVKLIEEAPNGSIWVIENSKQARQYIPQGI